MTKEEIEKRRAIIREAAHIYDIIELEKNSYDVLKKFGNIVEAKITFSGYDEEKN